VKRIHLKSLVVGLILGASALAVGAFKNDIGAFKNDPRYIERLVRAGGNLQLLSTLLYEHEGSIEAAPGLLLARPGARERYSTSRPPRGTGGVAWTTSPQTCNTPTPGSVTG